MIRSSSYVLGRAAIGLLCLVALLGAFVTTAGQAEAHGVQVASDPPPNARLPDSPAQISVTFGEPVEHSVTRAELWDQAGRKLTLGAVEFSPDDKEILVQVPEELGAGIYTVVWRNLSTVDGHTWQGSFPFTVLGPGGALPEGDVAAVVRELGQTPTGHPSTLESAARWVVLLGSAVMLGGAGYALFVASPAAGVLSVDAARDVRSLSRTVLLTTGAIAAFFVLEGSLLQLVTQADRLGGLGQADELLRDTRFGHYLIARQGLLAVALVALGLLWRAHGRAGEWSALGLLFLASLGVLLTQSLVSHAAASDGPVWSTAIDFTHLLVAALWVGGLIHVGLAMPQWLEQLRGAPRTLFAAESFRRFSALAAASVALLLLSGVLSAFIQFPALSELWSTSYGRSLLGKLGATVPLLLVGALNAFVLRPRVVAAAREVNGAPAPPDASDGIGAAVRALQQRLATTVRLEAVLAIAVLASVAVLIQLQSPRSTAQAEDPAGPAPAASAGGVSDQAEAAGLFFQLDVAPGRVGQNTFQLGLGSEFGPVGEVLDVRLAFDHQSEAGRSELELARAGENRYEATAANLSLAGDWEVTATVRRRNADDVRATFDVPAGQSRAGAASPQAGGDGGLWDWPFHGWRSGLAIAIVVAGLALAGWQLLGLRGGRV